MAMAYTLGDPYRGLRTIFRISGTAALLAGLVFLLLSTDSLRLWQLTPPVVIWPVRLLGAGFFSLGIFYLLASRETTIPASTVVTAIVINSLTALILIFAYFGGEFSGLDWPGLLLLVLTVLVTLIGAVMPLRYLRAEYREL